MTGGMPKSIPATLKADTTESSPRFSASSVGATIFPSNGCRFHATSRNAQTSFAWDDGKPFGLKDTRPSNKRISRTGLRSCIDRSRYVAATSTLQPKPTYQYRDCPSRFSTLRPTGFPFAPNAAERGASSTRFIGVLLAAHSSASLDFSWKNVMTEASPSPSSNPQLFALLANPRSTNTQSPELRPASSTVAARMLDKHLLWLS